MPYVFRNLFRRSHRSIGARLIACFVTILLLMIAADVVAVWQFSRIAAPGRRLSQADQTSLAVMRVHLDVDTFRGRVAALASAQNTRQFASEAASLRRKFLEDIAHARELLKSSPHIEQDPMILSTLETLQVTLPSQLETVMDLATADDWPAVRLRLADQVPSLIDLSSSLVESVDREVLQERAAAIESAERARQQLFLVLPITALLTLLIAVALGWYTTRAITDPLSELDAGAQALARGEFQHEVDVRGEDELATLGKAFNYAARRLRELYETVRQSEKQLRHVIETIPAMAWTALPDGSHAFSNRRWAEYTGLPVGDTAGSGWQAVIHPEDLDRHVEKWRASLSSGEPFENEVRFRRAANGEYRWFLVRSVPLRDEQGKILEWYGIATDIEDRKRAEALLEGEKRILEMVARGASLAQILDSLCRLVEEQAQDVLASILLVDGDRLRHGGAPSLPKAYTEAIDGVLIGPRAGSCGTAAHRGEPVIVSDIATDPLWASSPEAALSHGLRTCWSTPVFSSEGKVIATIAMYYREPRSPGARDQEIIEQITHLAGVAIERRRAIEELQAKQELLDLAQQAARAMAFDWHIQKEVNTWSPEQEALYGLPPGSFDGKYQSWKRLIYPDDWPLVVKAVKHAHETGDVSVEFRVRWPDGSTHWLAANGQMFFDDEGKPSRMVGFTADITRRKLAEEELQKAQAELAHINRVMTMGEMAASIAHEVNQPLAAVVTSANAATRWLAHQPPNVEKVHKALERIVKDVSRAGEVIKRTRSLVKKSPPQREWLNINETILEVIALTRSEAQKNRVWLQTQLSEELPKVQGDRIQLQQVILNLVINAIQAMSTVDEQRELLLRSSKDAENGVLVTVKDSGSGIEKEKLDHLFDAFYTTKRDGMGMGLSISRSIVESHGGRLWATNNGGRGATFYFSLPATGGAGNAPEVH